MEPRASRTVTLGALCFLILTGLPTKAQAGCPTVRLFGSVSLYPLQLLVSTYSMTSPAAPGTRPEYRNDESKSPVFFKQGYWHIGNENRIRVRDSSLYLEDITGTFEIWHSDEGDFVLDTKAHFSCADITYICKGDKKTIRCPRPDFQQLLIVRAAYGQDWACKLSGCTEREGGCVACNWISKNDVITRVMDRCTRAPGSCILEPSDEMFGGNPCDHVEGDVDTYLRVEHRCINVPLSLGCYQDEPVNNPLLTGPSVSHVNTTIQKCLKYCRAQSYRYAGVANRFGCRCGEQLQDSASRRLLITDCTAPCGGDDFQFCGGPSTSQKIEVFETSIGACGGDLKSNEGIIYSPDFPGPYPLDQNCVWNIQVAPEKVIRVKLELLDITTEDSLTIVEGNFSRSIVTFLNGTSEYVSFSSYVRLQFLAGPRRAQQTNGFILRFEGVGHCGPVTANDDVISVSPNHGKNFNIGQRVAITCKNGQNVTVLCQKNGTFDIPTPYCSEIVQITDRGQDVVAWAAPVSVLVAVLLVSIGVFAIFIFKRRRATKEPGTSTHDYDIVDPGTPDNDEYEMIDTRDSRPPAGSPHTPATFPSPPGVSGTQSGSDYQALDPRTMGNTNSEYTSLTTNHAHPDYENNHEYLDLSSQTTNRVRTEDSDYENEFEYEDTI